MSLVFNESPVYWFFELERVSLGPENRTGEKVKNIVGRICVYFRFQRGWQRRLWRSQRRRKQASKNSVYECSVGGAREGVPL